MSCPSELVYKITYLGGEMFNYSLNFSKPSSQILLQYYSFLRLGRAGYQQVMRNIMENARYLEKMLLATGRFEIAIERIEIPAGGGREAQGPASPATDAVSFVGRGTLRQHGWIVPAYPLPANAQETHVLRAVVKENFSRDLAEKFAADVASGLKKVDALLGILHKEVPEEKRQHVC